MFKLLQAACYADPFNRVVALPQPSRIDDVNRKSRHDQFPAQYITGGTGQISDDRHILLGKPVHQTGFTNVRRSGQNDLHSFAQQVALPGGLAQLRDFVLHGMQLCNDTMVIKQFNLLFRKIQYRFHQHPNFDELFANRVYPGRELPGQRALGTSNRGGR